MESLLKKKSRKVDLQYHINVYKLKNFNVISHSMNTENNFNVKISEKKLSETNFCQEKMLSLKLLSQKNEKRY